LLLFSVYDKKKFMSELKQKLHAMAPTIFEKTPVLFAYLYGSYAKGLSHPFSDLDVGIYIEDLDKRSCLDLELSLALRIDEELDHTV
jgi:predicted nucleotidyltransferase